LIAFRALAAVSLKEHSIQVANEDGQIIATVSLSKLEAT
jgi:hypothetical protein